MEGEEKKKKDKNKLKKLFGNKSKKAPDNFTLSSPVNFRQTAHVGFDPTTGEFEVFFLPSFITIFANQLYSPKLNRECPKNGPFYYSPPV